MRWDEENFPRLQPQYKWRETTARLFLSLSLYEHEGVSPLAPHTSSSQKRSKLFSVKHWAELSSSHDCDTMTHCSCFTVNHDKLHFLNTHCPERQYHLETSHFTAFRKKFPHIIKMHICVCDKQMIEIFHTALLLLFNYSRDQDNFFPRMFLTWWE